jgi:formylglycine-generating enzyme required for sulfatase activity
MNESQKATPHFYPPCTMKNVITFLSVCLAVNIPATAMAEAAAPPIKLARPAFTNSLGMVFVPVPATEVQFCKSETRVQDYATYARATGVEPEKAYFEQGPTEPAVNVSWEDARGFCRWLTAKEQAAGLIGSNNTYRLPTDAEWSHAVGLPEETGDTPAAKSMAARKVWPWGTDKPPHEGTGNYADTVFRRDYPVKSRFAIIEGYKDGFVRTAPVGSFRANQFAIHDLSGNVWEWCEDWMDAKKTHRVVRGGSWLSGEQAILASTFRFGLEPGRRIADFGFRCVFAGKDTP